MVSKNKSISELYKYYQNIFHNIELNKTIRIQAYSKMELIEALIDFYENNNEFNIDEITSIKNPVFPEEFKELNLKNYINKGEII